MLGAANVVRASDRLLVGPSRLDPAEHARVRATWWGSSEWDRLYAPDVVWEEPVVVWVSSSFADRVNLWRACSWLRSIDVAAGDVLVVDVAGGSFGCAGSVSDHADELLGQHLNLVRPWSRARHDRAVRLWEAFTEPSPERFARSCAGGASRSFPELGPLWSMLSGFFPRVTGAGALRLSRFDESLLAILSPEWQTPVSVFLHESDEWRQACSCTGDLFIAARLEQWAGHDPHAVERARAPGPVAESPMLSRVYRLTERGQGLRAGLDRLGDAPALSVGGVEVYASGAPWAVREGGELARVASP